MCTLLSHKPSALPPQAWLTQAEVWVPAAHCPHVDTRVVHTLLMLNACITVEQRCGFPGELLGAPSLRSLDLLGC